MKNQNYEFNQAKEKKALLEKGFQSGLATFKGLQKVEKPNGGIHYRMFFNVMNDSFPVNKYGYRSKVLMFHAHFASRLAKCDFYESLQDGDLVEVFYKENQSGDKLFLNLYTLHFKNSKMQRDARKATAVEPAVAVEVDSGADIPELTEF